jgi:hypothetical protein
MVVAINVPGMERFLYYVLNAYSEAFRAHAVSDETLKRAGKLPESQGCESVGVLR